METLAICIEDYICIGCEKESRKSTQLISVIFIIMDWILQMKVKFGVRIHV